MPNGIYGGYFKEYRNTNTALLTYAGLHNNTYFVTAKNLSANEDQLHFDAASLRRLGVRYYQAFKHQINIIEPLANEDLLLDAIYDRPLTSKEQAFTIESSFASGKITFKDFQQQIKAIR